MSAQSRCRTRGITRSFTRHLERSDIVMLRARADFMSAPRYDVTSPHPPRSRARRRARRPCSRRLFLRTGSPAVTATPTTTAAMESWFSAMTFELSDRFETHADAKAKPAGQGAEGPGRRKVRLWREHGRGPLARELSPVILASSGSGPLRRVCRARLSIVAASRTFDPASCQRGE